MTTLKQLDQKQLASKTIRIIRKNQRKEGLKLQELRAKTAKHGIQELGQALDQLLKEGEIYEPSPGQFKTIDR